MSRCCTGVVRALLLMLATGLPRVALADDAGPRRDVREIRYDLPKLIAAQNFSTPVRAITIDDVAVDGNGALAQWHDNGSQRIDYLVRRFDRWWLENEIYLDSKGSSAFYDTGCSSLGPTSLLLTSLKFPQPLVTLAARTLPDVMMADARPTPTLPPGGYLVKPGCDVYRYTIDDIAFSRQVQTPLNLGGYAMAVRLASNDADSSARIRGVGGRAPTEAESWMTRGGNSYFFFSGTVDSAAPIHVTAGTTIDVWFPFVLDSSLYYGLTIAHADKPMGPIDGTLNNNVVHFVLPGFTLPPGATLMGEIEGDSFRHQ